MRRYSNGSDHTLTTAFDTPGQVRIAERTACGPGGVNTCNSAAPAPPGAGAAFSW